MSYVVHPGDKVCLVSRYSHKMCNDVYQSRESYSVIIRLMTADFTGHITV